MGNPQSYCEFVLRLEDSNVHKIYHDTEYGFPVIDDDLLFERLVLEINQAGLSWTTILNKKKYFRIAYNNFDIKKVASYKENDVIRLLSDAGIIRNRLKIMATIHNANVILDLQNESGSFKNWLDTHSKNTKDDWVRFFKRTFKFTGGEIVNEFLISTAYLPNAHSSYCDISESISDMINTQV